LNLSQQRANSVLLYWFNSKEFKSLDEKAKGKLKFWISSNGMSNGQNVDSEGEYTYYS
jgi:hypothetical protein